METLRLRKIQQPSKVERLLEAYLSRSNVLPGGAYQIRNPGSVPAELRRIVTHAMAHGRVWSCWADSSHTWLFTCDMSLALSRQRGTPVLQICVYNQDGSLSDSGNFLTDADGKWQRWV